MKNKNSKYRPNMQIQNLTPPSWNKIATPFCKKTTKKHIKLKEKYKRITILKYTPDGPFMSNMVHLVT